MKKHTENIKVESKGITLIALVVTIIILIILSGVSINLILGEHGIIKQARLATKNTEEAQDKTKEDLEELSWELDDVLGKNNNEPVPDGMYYSIRNGEKKIYYATFQEAYEASVDNGGKYRGGTIVVEKDVTENLEEPIMINKTITIDLKQNTMTRNQRIYLISGTLTITGKDSSAIIGSGEDMVLLALANDANLTVTGSPLIQSPSHAIYTAQPNTHPADLSPDVTLLQSSGTVNLQGGYIVSTERSGMGIKGAGKVFINNTTVLGIRNDKNALSITEDSTSDIVIDGNSTIASGLEKNVSLPGTPTISDYGTGNLTIKGNTIVTAGLYASNAINLHKTITLTIEDNASIYAKNSRTVLVKANGTTLNINTRGIICNREARASIGINTGVDNVNCNIQSGIFTSEDPTKPLQEVKNYMENYPEDETQQSVEYYYLEDYKTLKSVTVPDLCVVKVGNN